MLEKARQIHDQMIAWRRDFHAHPELGFQETRTAARVAEVLRGLNARVQTGVARTGVVAELGHGKPVIAIRADMDALPIQEENDVPYASRHPGVMHACGHDAHTAILLGVATLLAREELPGTVRFLFQPAEEIEDDESKSGGERMVEEGAIEGADGALALHVDVTRPTGDITVEEGVGSAGVDTFYVTVIGQGGHGAAPHRVVDPIHIAGHVILALHSIVSRRLRPYDPAVISICTIHGGQADNVVPERVTMSGTIRFFTTEVQQQIHAEIARALEVTRALGGDYELRIEIGYPPMINDPRMAVLIREVVTDLLGEERLRPPRQEMGAEDFGYFSARVPGVMFALGCQRAGEKRRAHSPRFDIDEDCLPIGAAILSEAALRFLRRA